MPLAVTSSDMARSLTLRRYGNGAYVAGVWVPGATTDTAFVGSLQPFAGGVKTQLPSSGKRRRADVVVYTEDPNVVFRTVVQAGNQADRIVDGSTVYEVLATERYTEVIPHTVAYCALVDEAA